MHVNDNLADVLVRLHVLVGLDDLVERIVAIGLRLQGARAERGVRHLGEILRREDARANILFM